MPIHTEWGNPEHTVLIEQFRDDWSWKQVAEECQHVIHPLLENVTYPVTLIQDMLGSHWVPTMSLLREVETMLQTPYPDNVKLLVVVSGEPSVDTLVVSAYQRYGDEDCTYKSARSIKQAIQIAEQMLK